MAKRKKDGGSNFVVWLPEHGIFGRKGQITIECPDGQKMSVAAAARKYGIKPRTMAWRVQNKPEKDWFRPEHLRRKPSKATLKALTRSPRTLKGVRAIGDRPPNPYDNPIGLQRTKGRFTVSGSRRVL